MEDQPDRVRTVAPKHAAYWHTTAPPGYLGGRSPTGRAGVITLEVDSLEAAECVIVADPFVRDEQLEASVVKPWVPE